MFDTNKHVLIHVYLDNPIPTSPFLRHCTYQKKHYISAIWISIQFSINLCWEHGSIQDSCMVYSPIFIIKINNQMKVNTLQKTNIYHISQLGGKENHHLQNIPTFWWGFLWSFPTGGYTTSSLPWESISETGHALSPFRRDRVAIGVDHHVAASRGATHHVEVFTSWGGFFTGFPGADLGELGAVKVNTTTVDD